MQETELILRARSLAYRIFALAFSEEPKGSVLEALCGQTFQEALYLLNLQSNEAFVSNRAIFARKVSDLQAGGLSGAEERLTAEYTKLFIGPADLPAPPWESVYVGKDRVLFQACTLEVRRAYRLEGYLPAEAPHVADDHLSLELAFLGRLSEESIEAASQNNQHEYRRLAEAQISFLDDHLLRWVGQFRQSLCFGRESSFYAVLVELMASFVRNDRMLIDELVA